MTKRCVLASLVVASILVAPACWDEELREIDLTGTVKIPVELVPGGASTLGIAYLGVYAAADSDTLGFSYPFMGPVIGDQSWGNSYPYGGTSVGNYAYPCVREGKCRMVTGRYSDLDQVIDALALGQAEDPPWDDEALWDICRDYFGYTDPTELEFVGIDRLDFREEDGFFVADWKVWHVDPQDDAEGRPVLWAYVDNGMETCNPDGGASNRGDGPWFREGEVFPDVLNMPGKYLTAGDLITTTATDLVIDQRDGYEVVVDGLFEG